MSTKRMGRNPFQKQQPKKASEPEAKRPAAAPSRKRAVESVGFLSFASSQLELLRVYERFPLLKSLVDRGVVRTFAEALLPSYSHS